MAITDLLYETYFGNTVIEYVIFCAILITAIIAGKVVSYISKNIIRKIVNHTKTRFDNILIETLEQPLVFLMFIVGFYIAYKTLVLSEGSAKIFNEIFTLFIIIDFMWFSIKFFDSMIVHYLAPLTAKSKTDLDDHLIPILRKLIKVVIVIIAIIMMLDRFGVNVTSLVAGLGIGGLAVAFAAQKVLANMFGGITILSDRPFKIGDRIKISNYDGTVTDIGLRSTRIKPFDGTEIIVPNSIISDTIMENVSKEPSRRIVNVIGVTYDTSSKKLDEAKKIIEDVVKKNKNNEKQCDVFFDEFGAYSLNIRVIYYIKNIKELPAVKHAVNMEIKKRFEKAGIDMAFPTQTIELKK